MAFLLAADGRDEDPIAAFASYRAYLSSSRSKFPPHAFELASSDWYFDPKDHRSPHDAWLESVAFAEWGVGQRGEARGLTLTVRLLSAYHDGHIELRYPEVFAYRLDATDCRQGHGDWRYDEFRLSADHHVIHEIEWSGKSETARWLIEASDVHYTRIASPQPG